jgi:FkbM family methyltransferase
VHNVGVADASGERQFFVNNAPYTNSLFMVDAGSDSYVDRSETDSVGSVAVKVVDLDKFCECNGIKHVSILKMDVQGAELHALHGATDLLQRKRIDLIYLEVCFAPLYKGQASFRDIQGFLEGFGYHLAGLVEPGLTRRGFIAWSNAIFVARGIATGAEWLWR